VAIRYTLHLPNKHFGRIDKRGNLDFEGSTFKGEGNSVSKILVSSVGRFWKRGTNDEIRIYMR
jgi:hypothetical protein